MKSKLSVALAAAWCVLAVSPAIALTITYDHFATMSSVPGAVLFDNFDTVVDTSIGTITGGLPQDPNHGTPPAAGNFIIADGLLGSPFNVIVTFTNPVAYAGFAWGTPDTINELDIYTTVLPFSARSSAISVRSPRRLSIPTSEPVWERLSPNSS